jgi:hypothetical protein
MSLLSRLSGGRGDTTPPLLSREGCCCSCCVWDELQLTAITQVSAHEGLEQRYIFAPVSMQLQQVNQSHLLEANRFDPEEVTEFGKVTALVKPEQPENAKLFIWITVEGMVSVPVNPEQPWNVRRSMRVREEGSVKEPVKPEQPLKAEGPMVVIEEGMIKTPVSPEQLWKALAATLVMVGSRVISPSSRMKKDKFCWCSCK